MIGNDRYILYRIPENENSYRNIRDIKTVTKEELENDYISMIATLK